MWNAFQIVQKDIFCSLLIMGSTNLENEEKRREWSIVKR